MNRDHPQPQLPPRSQSQSSINDDPSVPILVRHTPIIQPWLTKLHLSADAFSDAELQALRELVTMDTGWRSQFRWTAIDSLLTKIFQLCAFPRRYQRDVSAHPPCYQHFVFPTNRAVTINDTGSLRRIILADVFRQAGEFYLDGVLTLFFTFMLFYNVSSDWGLSILWDQLQKNDLAAAESLVVVLSQWPKWALSLIAASPVLYATVRTLIAWKIVHAPEPKNWPTQPSYRCYGRELPWSLVTMPSQDQEKRLQQILIRPNTFGRWWRWLLPTPPCVKSGTQLMCLLPIAISWNGRVTHASNQVGVSGPTRPATIFRLVHLLRKMALTESGLTQLHAIRALKQVAHGVSLGDLAELSKIVLRTEIIQEHVRAKITALMALKAVHHLDHKTHWIGQRLAAKVYARYQLWALGDYELLGWQVLPCTAYKAAKLYFSVHLYAILIKTIIESIDCPDKPGFSFGTGYAPWASDYSEACFDELVRQFGFWPGQPASTLVNQIPKYHITSPYALDLSNKAGRLSGAQIAQIVSGLERNGIHVNSLNLADSALTSQADVEMLFPALTLLESLDFSNINTNAQPDCVEIDALATNFYYLQSLAKFNLSGNNINTASCKNQHQFFDALAQLTQLTSLDLYRNEFGASINSSLALTQSLGQLTRLTYLDLEINAIGQLGAEAIAYLGNSLAKLTNMDTLNLAGNNLGGRTNSRDFLSFTLGLSKLKVIRTLKLSQNDIGLKNASEAVLTASGIRQMQELSTLDLSYNSLGKIGDDGMAAIADSLMQLSNLTTLSLSNNAIDNSQLGLLSLAECLPRLAKLTYLDVSKNSIGWVNNTISTLFSRNLGLLTNIQQLDLSGNCFEYPQSNEGAISVGESLKRLSSLRGFSMLGNEDCALGMKNSHGVESIASGLSFHTRINTIDLSTNVIGYNSADGLTSIGINFATLGDLATLKLDNNAVTIHQSNLSSIVSLLYHLTSLSTFTILPNPLTRAPAISYRTAQLLNQALEQTKVKELIVPEIPNAQSMLAYLNTLPRSISELNLSKKLPTSPNAQMFKVLVQTLKDFTSLEHLDLSGNEIGSSTDGNFPENIIVLSNGLQYLSGLKSINLNLMLIGQSNDAAIALGQGLAKLTRLESLGLGQNSIGQEGINGTLSLAKGLKKLTKLTYLNLAEGPLGSLGTTSSVGVEALASSLANLTKLEHLDLSNNDIGLHGSSETYKLALSFSGMNNLKFLDLSGTRIGHENSFGINALLRVLPTLTTLETLNLNQINSTNITWSQAASIYSTIHRNQLEAVCRKELCFANKNTSSSTTNVQQFPPFTANYWLDTSDGYPPCAFPSGSTNILSTSKQGPQDALLPPCQHPPSPQANDLLNQLLRQSLMTGFALGARDEIANWIRSPRRQAVVRYGVLGLVAYSQGWDTMTALTSAGLALLTDYCKLDQRRAFQALLALLTLRLLREMARNPQTLWAGLLVAGVLNQLSGQVSYAAGRQTARFGQHLGASFFKPPPRMPEHESTSDNPTLRFQP